MHSLFLGAATVAGLLFRSRPSGSSASFIEFAARRCAITSAWKERHCMKDKEAASNDLAGSSVGRRASANRLVKQEYSL